MKGYTNTSKYPLISAGFLWDPPDAGEIVSIDAPFPSRILPPVLEKFAGATGPPPEPLSCRKSKWKSMKMYQKLLEMHANTVCNITTDTKHFDSLKQEAQKLCMTKKNME